MFREYCRRLGLLLSGLAVSAVGIVLMLQANIGLEPWSVLQQGMSKTFGITYGTAASIVGAAVIALAFFCGESFGLGTLANIFICPVMIDLLLYLNWIPLFTGLWSGLAALLAGMELLALGTWLYMKSALGSGPRDALMVVLARKTRRSVGVCRAAVEVVIVFIGWRLGGQVGIGTVLAAVGVGSLFNLNFFLLRFTPALLHHENPRIARPGYRAAFIKQGILRMTAIIRRILFRAFSFWQIGTCRNIDICINSAKNICLQSPFPLCYLNPVERRTA